MCVYVFVHDGASDISMHMSIPAATSRTPEQHLSARAWWRVKRRTSPRNLSWCMLTTQPMAVVVSCRPHPCARLNVHWPSFAVM